MPLKSKRRLVSQVWKKIARSLFKRMGGRGLFSSYPPWMFLHWRLFLNVLGVLASPTPLGQLMGLARTVDSWYRQSGELWTPEGWSCFLLYSSVLTQEKEKGKEMSWGKGEHKARAVAWLNAKARNSQFSLSAEAWLVPEWGAFQHRNAKLMHCSLANDIFLLLLPGKPFCMKGIKWHEALCLAGDRNQWLGSMLVVSLYMLPH